MWVGGDGQIARPGECQALITGAQRHFQLSTTLPAKLEWEWEWNTDPKEVNPVARNAQIGRNPHG